MSVPGSTNWKSSRLEVVVQGLAHHFQTARIEFGELVEKQDAAMRQRDFAGMWKPPATDQSRMRDGVVGTAKWTLPDQGRIGRQHIVHRVDARDFQRLVEGEVGMIEGSDRASKVFPLRAVRVLRNYNFRNLVGLLAESSANGTQVPRGKQDQT